MMKGLRRSAVIAVVMMCLMLFTACGGSGGTSEDNGSGGNGGTSANGGTSENNNTDAFAAFAGIWEADTSSYDGIVIDEDGSWTLYRNGDLYSSGELNYMEEGVWISPGNNTQWSRLSMENGGLLYAAPIGYFRPFEGEWNGTFVEKIEDWRDSAVISGRGFINHEDMDYVYVLVVVSDEGAVFYLDELEQTEVGSLIYPWEVPDAQNSVISVDLVDMNGDGATDVMFSFTSGQIVWYWDPENGYVVQEDRSFSLLTEENEDPGTYSDYFGFWEYADDGSVLEIREDDGRWYVYESGENAPFGGGLLKFEDGTVYLMNEDGSSDGIRLYFDQSGRLIESGYVLNYIGMTR